MQTLTEKDYPPLPAGPLAELRAQVVARGGAMAEPEQGRAPFLLVVTRQLAPLERAVPLTALAGKAKPGIIDRHYAPGDLERFEPLEEAAMPASPLYLLLDVERGEEFCGAIPKDAMAVIAERRRLLLTMEEGISFVTQHPTALAKNKCFSLGGSRCGDRRVPAVWISQGAPKLGWCWEGNPHTWLGMASAAERLGPQA
ncbi:DUF5701 family protein [Kitasatospora sp. GP82]|uniref:DUF5701 family protein n=1 Tax=Kitasatospora sp. GP82 TaxID=3035089 RepID=UPI0032AFDE48